MHLKNTSKKFNYQVCTHDWRWRPIPNSYTHSVTKNYLILAMAVGYFGFRNLLKFQYFLQIILVRFLLEISLYFQDN